jgi:hypothetical protein
MRSLGAAATHSNTHVRVPRLDRCSQSHSQRQSWSFEADDVCLLTEQRSPLPQGNAHAVSDFELTLLGNQAFVQQRLFAAVDGTFGAVFRDLRARMPMVDGPSDSRCWPEHSVVRVILCRLSPRISPCCAVRDSSGGQYGQTRS